MTLVVPIPCVMLVTDRVVSGGVDPLVEKIREAVACGVDIVQVREGDMPLVEHLELVQKVRVITKDRALLVVNDRVDIALAAGADGVHLTEKSLSIDAVRGLLRGREMIIGRSIHNSSSVGEIDPDYFLTGPIYKTQTHPDSVPLGTIELIDMLSLAQSPILAIGGINSENVLDVMSMGVQGVAAIRGVLEASGDEITQFTESVKAHFRGVSPDD